MVCVPLMMTCNLAPTDRALPVLINSDWGFTLLMFVFAFSDGYIVSMAMMFGPKAGSERNQGGNSRGFFLLEFQIEKSLEFWLEITLGGNSIG